MNWKLSEKLPYARMKAGDALIDAKYAAETVVGSMRP
jgi:hypothetical protein